MSNYYFLLPDNKPETFIEYTKKLINSGEFPFLREGITCVEIYNGKYDIPSLRVEQYNYWCFYGKNKKDGDIIRYDFVNKQELGEL
jgi:hypothetical protein